MAQIMPAFFKVLIDDFATHLRLPPYFIYKFGKLLPECPILRVRCGGSEGEWRVKADEVAAEGRCFTDGWPEFVTDLGLGRHDFLVFWLESQSRFLVEVYNEDGTAKILSHLSTAAQGKVSLKEEDSLEDDVKSSPPIVDVSRKRRKKTMSFSIKMKPSNRYRVTMPSNFLRETGMMGTRCLVLEDLRGREWPVLMSAHCQRSTNRTDMGRGWNEFRVKNGLLDGDTCTFSYTGGDEEGEDGSSGWLLQVDVMRASPKMEGCGSSLRQTRSKASH